jgi:hypothetical protein
MLRHSTLISPVISFPLNALRWEAPFFGTTDIAFFRIFGVAAASFRGFESVTADYRHYVSKLHFGQNESAEGSALESRPPSQAK